MTSKRIRASRIATYEKSTKYCKVSFIYEVFKPYFDKKSCKQVSKIILVYVCVVFKAGFFLLSTNYGFISCVYFTKFKELPTLGNQQYTSQQLSRAFANINFYCSFNAKPQLLMGCLWCGVVFHAG